MKKQITFILALLTVMVACTNLDETIYSNMQLSDVYKKTTDADAACIGLYTGLLNSYYLTAMLGSTTTTADTRHQNVVRGFYDNSQENIADYWSSSYETIRKANAVIDNLWNSPLSDTEKKPYIAEAMAMRSYSYLKLVKLWGDIPFRVAAKDVLSSDFKLTPMEQIYRQLMADMEWSIANIWKEMKQPRGRIDIIGAKMILADIYLTCASSARAYNPATSARALKPYYTAFDADKDIYWRRVKELCADVIASPYKLETTNWTKLWGLDNRFNKEHIWTTQTIPGVLGTTLLPYTPTYAVDICEGQAVGGAFMTYDWALSFDRNDVRFKNGIIWQYIDSRNNPNANGTYYVELWRRDLENRATTLTGNQRISHDTTYRYSTYQRLQTKKFYDQSYTKTNSTVGPAIQMPIYRTAEAYLFYAEAENELFSCTADAVNKINAIRTRAGVPTYVAGQFSKEVFRYRILKERQWEFALEGKDIFDIMRMGLLEEECAFKEILWDGKDLPANENPRPRTADNYWLPYPLAETSTNNSLRGIDRMNYN
ncbi:MAG: RagB/SusD family nutrient uptake outer membrane protein [Bacteroidales bacterium]|nr:RagB/SusD family nutrient uptake outer membrane protein [Bacteroidales bacterium]